MWTQFFIMFPMMVCLVWTAILLLDYLSARSSVCLRLLVFMMTSTILYAGHYVFFSEAISVIPFSDTLYGVANLSVYPLYLLYITQLTEGRIHRRQLFMFLPALLSGVTYGVLYTLMDVEEMHRFIHTYLYGNNMQGLTGMGLTMAWAHAISRLLFFVLVIVVLVRGYVFLHRFGQKVTSMYADLEGRTLRPVRILLHLFVATSFFSLFFNVIGRQYFDDAQWLLPIPSLLFSSLIFCIGYLGSRPMFSYIDLQQEQDDAELPYTEEGDDNTSDIVHQRIEALAMEIERLMREEQFFLKQDLRLSDIARQLGTNVRYVSIAINQVIGRPFADYINQYRIAYARELQRQQPRLPVVEVAHMSGYISMQSFYRNMRKFGKKEMGGVEEVRMKD